MMSEKHAELSSQANLEIGVKNKLEYWKNKLGNSTTLLSLPTDRPSSAHSTNLMSTLLTEWPRDLSHQINELAQRLNTSVAFILVASFEILLHRYTQQDDVSLLIINKKTSSEIDESGNLLQGSLNKMLLRTDFSHDPVFVELMKAVHTDILEAEEQQSKLFEALVISMIKDGLDIHSFPQIIFQVGTPENQQGNIAESSPLADLHLALIQTTGSLTMQWRYNSGLFNEETIARMSLHYRNIVSSIVFNPGEKISKLSLLSDQERRMMLVDWNNTRIDYSAHSIHQLFEEQVTKSPDALAIEMYTMGGADGVALNKTLTYQQLNQKANQLAHHLKVLGVGPDVLVAVCMTRSPALVVAVMGILKAGGAYLPTDPSYPKERLAFILKDSAATLLITEEDLSSNFAGNELHVIRLDSEWHTIAQHSDNNIAGVSDPLNLAYVIYTSGSTGLPKGTLITHGGVVNYLTWCIRHYNVTAGSGAPVNSSIAFDATVTSFFAPLLTGKRVLLVPEKQEIEALAEVLLSRQHFSLVKITPAHLDILRHMFAESELDGQANCFVIGGEALAGAVIQPWRIYASSTRLINEYGPTETVVGCCTYEIGGTEYVGEDVPIGKPIANTQMFILDRHMQPVPIGVTGEIYIGGAGLARGYLNRPDLTEQRFIQNPFDENARLYRTGDLGRYLPDGNIIFQGRIDQQVKIRGYRIELGEVESALASHPLIQQIAVLAKVDNGGNKRLVAYVSTKNPAPSASDLRAYLKEKLPEYMIPAIVVFLERLPLTTNGKLDRAALPLPEQVQALHRISLIEPRTDTERALKKIFEKSLNQSNIGITDDFFEMGGNSVQAAIAFSQIRKMLGKSLPLSTLITAPTIEKLSELISAPIEKASFTSLIPIQPNGNRVPLFCIHGGLGNVLFYRHLSNHLGTDQPVYGLQARGLAGNDTPHGSIEEMATDYIREIRSVQAEGPYHLAGYCFGAIVAFEVARQLVQAGQQVAFLGSFNGIGPVRHYPIRFSSLFRMYRTDSLKNIALYPLLLSKFLLRRYSLLTYYSVVYKARDLAYRFYTKKGRMVPDALRRQYVVDAIHRALKTYQPKPYFGELVIFRSPQIFKDPYLRWKKLITGAIKTHDMPGNYKNRQLIMYEPYVASLADELKHYLGQA